jgi:hypothetical protein
VYPPIVARYQIGKDVPAATKSCWRRRFVCGPCRIKRKQAISSSQNFLYLPLLPALLNVTLLDCFLCYPSHKTTHLMAPGSCLFAQSTDAVSLFPVTYRYHFTRHSLICNRKWRQQILSNPRDIFIKLYGITS